MVETMRVEEENDSDEQKKLREMFKTDLSKLLCLLVGKCLLTWCMYPDSALSGTILTKR